MRRNTKPTQETRWIEKDSGVQVTVILDHVVKEIQGVPCLLGWTEPDIVTFVYHNRKQKVATLPVKEFFEQFEHRSVWLKRGSFGRSQGISLKGNHIDINS